MLRALRIIYIAITLCCSGQTFADAASLRPARACAEVPARVIGTVPVPDGYHEGLYYDGSDMWLANGMCGDIWVIDILTGAVKETIKPISTFTEGISKCGENEYFVTDWDDRKLYRAHRQGNALVPEASVSFAPAHAAGVVWTGSRLFVITWTRGLGTKFDLVELDREMRVVCTYRIRGIQEPSQLAWDGKYLWVSSWYSKCVYQVDIAAMAIVGSFRSPVPLTTGIVCEGGTMWLTGTHSDLYRIEVAR